MKNNITRRSFVNNSSKLLAAATLTPALINISGNTSVSTSKVLKVGLIGCGGRGTGAANQALNADNNVIITAMADVFEDRLHQSLHNLEKLHPQRVKVNKSNLHLGFDAWQKVINSDVDVILLATPPAFRPDHLAAAVAAGKHVFCEKPMAVDAPGVRKILTAAKEARKKELSLVAGFCWRYHYPKRATFDKILNGSIGKVTSVYNTYNTGELWSRAKQPEWSKLEYELRNWLYYNWLSGDHIAEQAVHSLDMMSWAMGDQTPIRATGTGGRQSRTEDIYGNVFDHFAIVYEYPDNVKGYHFSRQQKNCSNSYAVQISGTKGNANIDCIRRVHEISNEESWQYQGEENNMYQTEHDELFASIRKVKPINDGEWMAKSTMLAIMGRMAAYTGQTIEWKEALALEEKIGPSIDEYNWQLKWPMAPVAKPGRKL